MKKVYQRIASCLAAIQNCDKVGNSEWPHKHRETLDTLIIENMPRGSGFDSGTTLLETSTFERLQFATSFHHMSEHGCYDGWTEHIVTVCPSLLYGFTLKISGRDRNAIKDYIHEAFDVALSAEVADRATIAA